MRASSRQEDPINTEKEDLRRDNGCSGDGKLFVVGIGPGSIEDRTFRAVSAIARSQVVVGYSKYIELITDLISDKRVFATGMRQERERCEQALLLASQGDTVSLISSGDAGIYGMAGLAIELRRKMRLSVPVEIIPGVTASTAASAAMGAPLMLDFAVISLSDLLVPWEMIRKRLECVAEADLVVALYNPRSKRRVSQLDEAAEIFRKSRPDSTPVGIATAIGSEFQSVVLSDLGNFLNFEINMRSIVIIGNTASQILDSLFVTPRGYLK